MIKKLQRKFIMISGLAVIVIMVCFLLPVNLINRVRVGNELKRTLRFIMDSGGDLSGLKETEREDPPAAQAGPVFLLTARLSGEDARRAGALLREMGIPVQLCEVKG